MSTTAATTATTAAIIADAIRTKGFGRAAHLNLELRTTAARVAVDIADLVAEGTIPATAASWGELHSYCDANVLGDVDDDELDYDIWSYVTDTIDAWLAELPFTEGVAGVNVGDRVDWSNTGSSFGGAGVVTAVDGGTVVIRTDDGVTVVFGTLHPRADVLRMYQDIDNTTGYLSHLSVVTSAEPLGDDTVIVIEWNETVIHSTAMPARELRTALHAVLAADPNEVPESVEDVATADAETLIEVLREADGIGGVGAFLVQRNGRDALRVVGRMITDVRAR